MESQIDQGLDKMYQVKTPDNEEFIFHKINFSVGQKMSASSSIEKKQVNFNYLPQNVFRLYSGEILYEATTDKSYFLLFPSQEDFDKFANGKFYWQTSLFFDNKGDVNSFFGIRPEKGLKLIKSSVKVDYTFSIKGNSLQYILYYLEDGSVAYLSQRNTTLYDGYWFPNFDQFYYIYQNVFN